MNRGGPLSKARTHRQIGKEERNLMLEEMAALDSAHKTVIDALVFGDMEMITASLPQDYLGE